MAEVVYLLVWANGYGYLDEIVGARLTREAAEAEVQRVQAAIDAFHAAEKASGVYDGGLRIEEVSLDGHAEVHPSNYLYSYLKVPG